MSAGSRGRYEGVPSCLRVEIFSSKGDRYLMKERAGWEVFGGKICRFTGARSSCFVFSASCFWFWFSGIYYKHARCDFDPLGGLYPALESACYVGRASYFYVVGGGGVVFTKATAFFVRGCSCLVLVLFCLLAAFCAVLASVHALLPVASRSFLVIAVHTSFRRNSNRLVTARRQPEFM